MIEIVLIPLMWWLVGEKACQSTTRNPAACRLGRPDKVCGKDGHFPGSNIRICKCAELANAGSRNSECFCQDLDFTSSLQQGALFSGPGPQLLAGRIVNQ